MTDYTYPVRVWDSNSNTGELMELFHEIGTAYEKGYAEEKGKEMNRQQFEEKRGMLIWGVQTKKVTFTLLSDGRLDALFCKDNLDEVCN